MMKHFTGFLLTLLLAGVLSRPNDEGLAASIDNIEYSEVADSEYDDDESNDGQRAEAGTSDGDIPVFEVTESEVIVREGEPFELSCTTVEPTIHTVILYSGDIILYVGNTKVMPNARFDINKNSTYAIASAIRQDAGVYQCMYQVVEHKYYKNYTVQVQYPAQITSSSRAKQRVQKGATVTFECAVKAVPSTEITWTKEDGKLISGAESETGLSITFEDVDRHVEGTYICSADNGIGEPSFASMKLIVEYPPEIIAEKAIIRTGNGDEVQLVCIVHARPAASVTWSKDDIALTMEPNVEEEHMGHRHSIDISPVTINDFGSYNCTAINAMGEDSKVINLTDLPKRPIFTSDPVSAEETAYTLTWQTESYYPITEYTLKYRSSSENNSNEWMEVSDGIEDDDQEDSNLIQEFKHRLEDLEPATDYEAVVSVKNKLHWGAETLFKFSTKKDAKLPSDKADTESTDYSDLIFDGIDYEYMRDYPEYPSELDFPVFEETETDIIVREGEPFELSCRTVKPTIHTVILYSSNIILYVGKTRIMPNVRFDIKNNSTYVIASAIRQDAGLYQCMYQVVEQKYYKKYTVQVQYPAQITSLSRAKQRVQKGATVTFECAVKAAPPTEITWTKEDGQLLSGAKSETGLSITLEDVDRHVEGTYRCSADNGIGKPSFASMKLIVEYPPEITTERWICRTGDGDKVQLVCIVHARPTASVTWSKDGIALIMKHNVEEGDMGHRHSINIAPVSNKDFGSYKCTASNAMGEESEVINLTETADPHFGGDGGVAILNIANLFLSLLMAVM